MAEPGKPTVTDHIATGLADHMADVVRRAGLTPIQAAILSRELYATFDDPDRLRALTFAIDAARIPTRTP